MIEDLASGGLEREARADICVIGAGPAGITLALELAARGRRVILAEAGGLLPETETQALYGGECVGHPMALDEGRYRVLGGAATQWTGRCAPLDDIDFERREWVAHSGWPIGAETLKPYYAAAARYCGFSAPWGAGDLSVEAPPFDPDRIAAQVWRYAPQGRVRRYRDWGRDYFEDLRRAPGLRVILHANAVEFEPQSRRIAAVSFASLHGQRLRVTADAFVLCCGGAENARLLLVCREQAPELLGGGDWIGRCFMQHPRGVIATVRADRAASERLQDAFNVLARRSGLQTELGFALSPSVQRRENLLNASAILTYTADPNAPWERLKQAVRGDVGALAAALGRPRAIARNLWRRGVLGHHPLLETQAIAVVADLEQAPDPESRVTLGAEKDALGMPRLRVDWRIGAQERATAARFAVVLAEEFSRLRLGELTPAPWASSPGLMPTEALSGTFHHIGAARMSEGPATGVVDADCRVHGVDNLFVQGCAVFPTGGHANPTFTIVALALRQADFLAPPPTDVRAH
ncbi:MAG: GMC family oxidoreductase [Hyphomonadaceae bacterium]|nr:GMC family oxidoreductase [Hyphomonadaceae bacterium]